MELSLHRTLVLLLAVLAIPGPAQTPDPFATAFVNFESVPVHPIEINPYGSKLAVCNLADGKLEIFDITSGLPVPEAAVPVGLDPVSVRFRDLNQAWVVNQISDSISVVDIPTTRVLATIDTLDTPEDVVFAGNPLRAYVSCSLPNTIQVFDPETRMLLTNVVVEAERPKALAVSPDGQSVYAAIFESGNGTTLVGPRFRNLLFFDNPVSSPSSPYGGRNPPPNEGDQFQPPLNPALPGPIPLTGLIVRKNEDGRWMDDNAHDWTAFVSGANAASTRRVPGWDLPDRDLAVIHTTDQSISYATGLMNICMALAVNPASGAIAVLGTDAINQVRFEPNLNGIFVRVQLALVNPSTLSATVQDANPHLDYSAPTVPPATRDLSLGDPRAAVWSADGTRAYVAGMGSRNVIVVDAAGNRIGPNPLEVGEGPCGLALDETRGRLYVFNRFSSSLSVVDTHALTVIDARVLFDPTPLTTATGRRHLYDTRRTSGLGQASCASCHVDARMDRLGWDLGNPAGTSISNLVNRQGILATNVFHPMKGVMATQTLQDIMGHEPFHWRGDRPDLESFNGTFTNLQGAATALSDGEMREFKEFLAAIRFPPNPYRGVDNALPTNLALPGHKALGDDLLPAGAPLPNGNAVAGLAAFRAPVNFCATCHTLPTGLGADTALQDGQIQPIPTGPNGEHHHPVALRLEGSLRSKIAQFRNMADKIGMDGTQLESRAGFGFGHDGSIDTMTRFLQGVRIVRDQDMADLIAFLLAVPGSDTGVAGDPIDPTPPSGVGRQVTLNAPSRPPLLDAMLAQASAPDSRVELIAKGTRQGLSRGWFYVRAQARFQSDREKQSVSPDDLIALAGPGSELTFTLVPTGTGVRLGIDRDLDGSLDSDERNLGTNPAEPQLRPRIVASSFTVALGTELSLWSTIPPLPYPGTYAWWKDGQPLEGATNTTYILPMADFANSGDYSLIVTTPFLSLTSAPMHVLVAPLLVEVSPLSQQVRLGSNAVFTATVSGPGPFEFQWMFGSEPKAGATEASLVITNAQLADEGIYQVTVANAHGSVTSAPVVLGVLMNPKVILPPVSQQVVEGGNVTFSVMIDGYPPPFGYALRKGSTFLTNYMSEDRLGFLSLFNVQAAQAGTYRLVVTNAANAATPLTLDPVTLTVLTDTDKDGLPDAWESLHLLNPNDPTDAGLDADMDGLDNLAEFTAGTDPQAADDFLRLGDVSVLADQAAVVVHFEARSNKTYTVQYKDEPGAQIWTKAADVLMTATNRSVSVTNQVGSAPIRFYRLLTPQVP